MKNTFFLILLSTISCASQTVIVKYFENEVNTNAIKVKDFPKNIQIIYKPNFYSNELISSGKFSQYKNEKINFKMEDEIFETTILNESGDSIDAMVVSDGIDLRIKEKFITKDFEKNKIYEELFFGEKYKVYDNLVEWNWEIVGETEIILGYKCKKAKSTSFGNEVMAWFAEDIPISNGPARFNGLPGLILKIKLSFLEIIAYDIKFKKEKTKVDHPVLDGKIFTYNELIKIVNSGNK